MNQIDRKDFLKKIATSGLGMGAFLSYPIFTSRYQISGPFQTGAKKDFIIRGFHIDLRVEVMTMKALKKFVRQLHGFGINALIIEYEASYPYQKHATISNKYAYSRKEIKEFVSFYSELGIEVIPLQECFGHVQYILRHERYAKLKVGSTILSQVDPLNNDTIPLFAELIEDMASLHPSKYLHVGGDEVCLLNHAKFADYIQKNGVSRLYTQYMGKICQIVINMGKKPLLWADMILQHPEAVDDLPVDQIIFVDWNYGWDINRSQIKALQDKGCTFWGAPALRCSPDNYYLTHWETHFNNIENFIPYSRDAGYEGIFMTSWSTSGIYNYWVEGNEKAVLEMFPIRNLYPLSGFRILVAAYAHALNMEEPINPQNFVVQYGKHRFGLSEDDAQKLWRYLAHDQLLIFPDTVRDEEEVEAILNHFKEINVSIHNIIPARNQDEFEHFLLMGDIREFYLSVIKIQAVVESLGFERDQMEIVGEKLNTLKEVSEKLNKAFIGLNKGYLYDAELKRLNRLRNKRLYNLCDIYCKKG